MKVRWNFVDLEQMNDNHNTLVLTIKVHQRSYHSSRRIINIFPVPKSWCSKRKTKRIRNSTKYFFKMPSNKKCILIVGVFKL